MTNNERITANNAELREAIDVENAPFAYEETNQALERILAGK